MATERMRLCMHAAVRLRVCVGVCVCACANMPAREAGTVGTDTRCGYVWLGQAWVDAAKPRGSRVAHGHDISG